MKMVGRKCGKESGQVLEFTPRYGARREAIGRGGVGSVTSDYHWRWKWRRVPVIITAEGGNWLWRLATGGLAKFSSWCTKYVG